MTKTVKAAPKKAPVAAVRENRETWLRQAVAKLVKHVFAPKGVVVPPDVQVSCSFPGGGSPNRRIGECWPRARSANKVNEVFINPVLSDSIKVLDVLGHELLHSVDDCASGHGAVFTRNSKAIGYTGGKHSKAEAPTLLVFDRIAKELGPYPHGALNAAKKTKNASAGLHKFQCAGEGGDVLYSTVKKVDDFGVPLCRCCGEEMILADRQKQKVVTTV